MNAGIIGQLGGLGVRCNIQLGITAFAGTSIPVHKGVKEPLCSGGVNGFTGAKAAGDVAFYIVIVTICVAGGSGNGDTAAGNGADGLLGAVLADSVLVISFHHQLTAYRAADVCGAVAIVSSSDMAGFVNSEVTAGIQTNLPVA